MRGVKDFSINKKRKGWSKFLIGAVVVFLILFVVNLFISPIRNYIFAVSAPVQQTFWAASESSATFFNSFFQANSLASENEDLKSENQKLLSQVAALQSVEQGNQAQSDISAACQSNGFKTVMAGVVGLSDNDVLSISKGSADGVSIGMPVINQQNVLVGKIFKVYKNFSNIMLVSNKNSVINVKVQQSSPVIATATATAATGSVAPTLPPEIDGVIRGDGGLNAHLDLIPISSDINPQDVLVTSAVEKSFPKDLLVAKIIQKIKNDQKPFQQAQISLFFDVKTADNLFVITNYKQTN